MAHNPEWNTTAPIICAAAAVCLSFIISLALSPILSKRSLESAAVLLRIFFLVYIAFAAVVGLIVPGWYSIELNGRFTVDPTNQTKPQPTQFYVEFSLWGLHMVTQYTDAKDPIQDCSVNWAYGPIGATFLDGEYEKALDRPDPVPALCVMQYLTAYGVRYLSAPPPVTAFKTAAIWTGMMLSMALASLLVAVIFLHSIVRYGCFWLFISGVLFFIAIAIEYGMVVNNPAASHLFQTCSKLANDGINVSDLSLETGWVLVVCIVAGALAVILGVIIFVLDLRYPQLTARLFSIDVASQLVSETVAPVEPTPTGVKKDSKDSLNDVFPKTEIPSYQSQPQKSTSRGESIMNKFQKPRRSPSSLQTNSSFGKQGEARPAQTLP